MSNIKTKNIPSYTTILVLVVVAVVATGLLLLWVQKAGATYTYNDQKVSYGHWSKCQTEEVCGEGKGIQTQTNTYVCEEKSGRDKDECQIDTNNCVKWEGAFFWKRCVKSVTEVKESRSCKVELPACEPDPEPTPEVTPTPEPEQPYTPPVVHGVSEWKPPACPDQNTLLLPYNLHVIRRGPMAEVKWVPTEASEVNLYYKENGQNVWTHAVRDEKNDGFLVVEGLNSKVGYTFGLQQKNGCAGGQTAVAVVIDPPANGKLFPMTHWEWL